MLQELVDDGDLDPSVPPQIARYQLGGGAVLDWSPAAATAFVDPSSGATLSCITTGTIRASTVPRGEPRPLRGYPDGHCGTQIGKAIRSDAPSRPGVAPASAPSSPP